MFTKVRIFILIANLYPSILAVFHTLSPGYAILPLILNTHFKPFLYLCTCITVNAR